MRLTEHGSVCYGKSGSVDSKALAHLDRMIRRYPALEVCAADVEEAFCILRDALAQGGKLLMLGNGGGAADAGHIVGER